MSLVPITEVSREYNISTRTLRYYEEIGLLTSDSKEGYAYRVYNGSQLERLQQIVILRKLRISLKQISEIFKNDEINKTLAILTQNMRETENEIDYLQKIKNALNFLIERLCADHLLKANLKSLDDSGALRIIDSLPSKNNLKENRKVSNQTNPERPKLRDVRIVYLPPATVASYQYEGDEPENKVAAVVDDFVRKNNLTKIKPDLRHYGFNAPNPVDETNRHGYEMWVTVPDDFPVPAPLVKKQFEGGVYAAHMISMGAFHEWHWLFEWVDTHEKYAFYQTKGYEVMEGLLEEHLNYVGHVESGNAWPKEDLQLDLLMPVKEKAEIDKEFTSALDKKDKSVVNLFIRLEKLVRQYSDIKEKIVNSMQSRMYYMDQERFVIMTPQPQQNKYVSVFTPVIKKYTGKLTGYETTEYGVLRLKPEQQFPEEILEKVFKEVFGK